MFKNRTHAVTFRLAESEFQELTKTAVSQGARSLSDFARAAVMAQVAAASGNCFSREDIENIAKRLDAFDLTLNDLRSRVLQSLHALTPKEPPMKNDSPEAAASLTETSNFL